MRASLAEMVWIWDWAVERVRRVRRADGSVGCLEVLRGSDVVLVEVREELREVLRLEVRTDRKATSQREEKAIRRMEVRVSAETVWGGGDCGGVPWARLSRSVRLVDG